VTGCHSVTPTIFDRDHMYILYDLDHHNHFDSHPPRFGSYTLPAAISNSEREVLVVVGMMLENVSGGGLRKAGDHTIYYPVAKDRPRKPAGKGSARL